MGLCVCGQPDAHSSHNGLDRHGGCCCGGCGGCGARRNGFPFYFLFAVLVARAHARTHARTHERSTHARTRSPSNAPSPGRPGLGTSRSRSRASRSSTRGDETRREEAHCKGGFSSRNFFLGRERGNGSNGTRSTLAAAKRQTLNTRFAPLIWMLHC